MREKKHVIEPKRNILSGWMAEFIWEYDEYKNINIVEGSSIFDLAILLLGDKIYPKTWKYVTLRQYLLAGYIRKCEILDVSLIDEQSKILLHEFIVLKCTENSDIIYMSLNNFCKQLFTGDEYIMPIIWKRITIKDYFEADIENKNIIITYLDNINLNNIIDRNRYNEFYKPFIELEITRIFRQLILKDKIIYEHLEILKILNSLQQCKFTKTKINYAKDLLDETINRLPRYKSFFQRIFLL